MQSVEFGCDHLEFSPVLLVSESSPVIIMLTHSCLHMYIQVALLQTAGPVLVGAMSVSLYSFKQIFALC